MLFSIFGCSVNDRKEVDKTPAILEFRLGSFENFPDSVKYLSDDKERSVYLHNKSVLNSSHIKSANYSLDPIFGIEYGVRIELNETGTKLLGDITKTNINKVMAIIVNGEVVLAATIRDPIMHGRIYISGLQSKENAERLNKNINRAIKG